MVPQKRLTLIAAALAAGIGLGVPMVVDKDYPPKLPKENKTKPEKKRDRNKRHRRV